MTPVDSTMLQKQVDFASIGLQIEAYLHGLIEGAPERSIEDIRRDLRGKLYIQFAQSGWGSVSPYMQSQGPISITLQSMGEWTLSPLPSSKLQGMTPIVLSNLPTNIQLDDILVEIVTRNWHILKMDITNMMDHLCEPRRLQKWDRMTVSWQESKSVCTWASHVLAQCIVELRVLQLYFRMVPIHKIRWVEDRCTN